MHVSGSFLAFPAHAPTLPHPHSLCYTTASRRARTRPQRAALKAQNWDGGHLIIPYKYGGQVDEQISPLTIPLSTLLATWRMEQRGETMAPVHPSSALTRPELQDHPCQNSKPWPLYRHNDGKAAMQPAPGSPLPWGSTVFPPRGVQGSPPFKSSSNPHLPTPFLGELFPLTSAGF